MAATGSSAAALTVSVAPNCCASSSLKSLTSTAMILAAPDRLAPWITFRPTPPQPMTATALPACTAAVLMTAPTPVITPQPMSAALSRGMSSRIFTRPDSGTTVRSAKQAVQVMW